MNEVFLKIVNMSISAVWLVLAVLALRLMLRKVPKWINVALWGIVAVRLLCPFSVESVMSLIPSAQTIPLDIGMDTTPAIHSGVSSINSFVNPIISQSNTPAPGASVNPLQIVLAVCANVWVLGVAGMGLYALVSWLRLRGCVATAVRARENIYCSANVPSPFVLGILKPRIYLPAGLDGQEAELVIAHERAHICRRDHWWKPLGFLLLTVHWFNPFVWAAYICLCRDIELACDERVIRSLGREQRADYTQALVNCSISRRLVAACPLAFGEVGVKERVKRVMYYKKPGFWAVVAAVAVCILVAVCFLTDPVTGGTDALPLVHSHSYGVVEVTYQSGNTIDAMVAQVNTPGYAIWEDMSLLSRGEYSDDWTNLGVLTQAELSRENFDELFYENGNWAQGEDAPSIRRRTVNAWSLVYDQEVLYYLLQLENGELFLAYGYYDHLEKGDPGSDDTAIRWLYRLAVDTGGAYGLVVHSGENAVPVTLFPAGTEVKKDNAAIHWLTIDADREETVPFRIYRDGEEVYNLYTVVDAESGEPLEYLMPSGLEPQTYLFQNADPEREYIVTTMLPEDADGFFWCFGVRFEQTGNPVLKAKVMEIRDGYFLVEPVEGSWERSSASLIEVPMEHMEPSPEPQVGDILRIEYDGQILETYPGRLNEVFRISVEETAQSTGVTMIPTDAGIDGVFDRYLYLTLEGEKYRYERQETMPEGIQAGALMCTVYEEDGLGERYDYDVFSVENCTDETMVLVHSKEMDMMWLYTYSPSKAVEETALQRVKDAGFVVMEDGEATCGQEGWQDFYSAVQAGEPASVMLASYHTLDPERCTEQYYEAYREDYPSMYLKKLTYDGETYTIRWEEYGTEYVKTYRCLMRYDGSSPTTAWQGKDPYVRYVLTNDDTVLWEDIFNGLVSSQYGAYIDHHTVYVERRG